MASRTTLLRELIRDEICRQGPMSFARFMELALYHPQFGYYEQPQRPIGARGDYYTSVSVGSLLGELLAFQFAAWSDQSAAAPFHIVEAGAHDGQLAADILGWLRQYRPALHVEYWILEPSPRRQAAQEKRLAPFLEKARWAPGWGQLRHCLDSSPAHGMVQGVIFANELLDALPFFRVGWDARRQQWFEWRVDGRDQAFTWVRHPWGSSRWGPGNPAPRGSHSAPVGGLPIAPPDLLAVLPDDFTTEVGSAALAWWTEAARALKRGWLLTLDYGLPAEAFLDPGRGRGTARGYWRHQLTDDLLARPGEQDLTAHVNFTALQAAGEAAGLQTHGLFPQGVFLTRLAESILQDPGQFAPWTSRRLRQFQTLTHPSHLGRAFSVFLQSLRPHGGQ